MSGRTEVVKAYVTEQTRDDLDTVADEQGMSRSELINHYVERGLRQDREDELAAETRAARQLQDIIDQGLDDFRDLADDMKEMQARAGAHSVATFELIKEDHPEQRIQESFRTGRDRLRDDVDPADVSDKSTSDDDEEGGYWD